MLQEDKQRSERDNSSRCERDYGDISHYRKEIDELKLVLGDKTRQNNALHDEIARNKKILDDRLYECSKLQEDSTKRSEANLNLRDQVNDYEREVRLQRSCPARHAEGPPQRQPAGDEPPPRHQ